MSDAPAACPDSEVLIDRTIEVASAYLSAGASLPPSEIQAAILAIHGALALISGKSVPPAADVKVEALVPAVPIKKSVTHEHLICLEDGKKLKMLKRHLAVHFNMTLDQYRAKWGLPRDYPSVAPAYSEKRSGLAKDLGLGKRRAA